MSRPDVDDLTRVATAGERAIGRDLRQIMLSGLALTVPLFVTFLVLKWGLDTLSNAMAPLVDLLVAIGPFQWTARVFVELLAMSLVFGLVFVVGLAAHHGPETRLGDRVDRLMGDIPGIGTIYASVARLSDVLVEGDTESFREVKLVEYPADGSYAIAFLTADTAPVIEDAVGAPDMVTVFMPLAPNPVMGGHLLHLPSERVHDVDLSVEEAMEAVMTTGLVVDESAREGTA